MGVYIKGLTKEDWNNLTIEEIEEGFEIVEIKTPHGRLIDESVLNERAKLLVTNFDLGITLYEQLDEFYKVAEIPTVIESEAE